MSDCPECGSDEYCESCFSCSTCRYNDMLTAQRRIKELEQRNDDLNFRCVTAEEKLCSMEWISVDDRLPETERTDVLAITNEGAYSATEFASMLHGVMCSESGDPVTHWMPIPPIEQEGSDE